MSTKNFDLKEVIYCGFNDPQPGTTLHSWWQGMEPKIPGHFAFIMYWLLYEATDCFITPDNNWDQIPERYKPIDKNLAFAIENIDLDIKRHIEIIASLPARNGYLIEPNEFESIAWKHEFFKHDYIRSFAAYIVYCVDTAFGALLAGDAPLAASAVAFADTIALIMRIARSPDEVEKTDRVTRSELAKHAAGYRHEPTRAMKKEAIRLYCEKTDWPSRRQATKAICPIVQSFGKEHHNHQLSPDRAEQTVYEWLTEHDKKSR